MTVKIYELRTRHKSSEEAATLIINELKKDGKYAPSHLYRCLVTDKKSLRRLLKRIIRRGTDRHPSKYQEYLIKAREERNDTGKEYWLDAEDAELIKLCTEEAKLRTELNKDDEFSLDPKRIYAGEKSQLVELINDYAMQKKLYEDEIALVVVYKKDCLISFGYLGDLDLYEAKKGRTLRDALVAGIIIK